MSDLTAYTHLTLVVDRSGSMESMADEANSSIRKMLDDQFNEPGKLTVTLVSFDNVSECAARMKDERFDFTLVPRGMTALFDAVGAEIVATGKDLAEMDQDGRPSKVVFVIVTDGLENSSSDFTLEAVKEMIAKQKDEYSWSFLFIGAGEAAWQGSNLGIISGSYSGKSGSLSNAYGSMSANLASFRANTSSNATLEVPENLD